MRAIFYCASMRETGEGGTEGKRNGGLGIYAES